MCVCMYVCIYEADSDSVRATSSGFNKKLDILHPFACRVLRTSLCEPYLGIHPQSGQPGRWLLNRATLGAVALLEMRETVLPKAESETDAGDN
jgi:hypothetical protein